MNIEDRQFMHEQFKRVWDDINGFREYVRLQFQHYDSLLIQKARKEEKKESELVNILAKFSRCAMTIADAENDIITLAKKKVQEYFDGSVEWTNRYELFDSRKIKQKLEEM